MPENKLEEAIKELNKKHSKFGGKAVMELDKMNNANVESIPTNCYSLDYVFGCGGLPRGRMIEIFGQESCLSGNTFISYHIRDKQGLPQNGKGGTIKHLYERFHGMKINGSGNYQRKQTINSDYFVSSINENNGIIKNKINDVVFCGVKECFEVTTISGERLVCTGEHKFYIGDGDYLPLNELSVGSVVYIHDNTTVKGRAPQIRYKEILVKYHPRKIKKIVNGYTYYRVKKAHAVYEADKLGLTLSEYADFLNTQSKKIIDSIWIVPKGFHIHHKNFDPHCDSLDNLVLLSGKEHNRLHALNNGDKLNFVVTEDVIKSIKGVGKIPTYDIKCQSPYNNYVANKIVVHNSGKTTMAMFILAQVQKQGGKALFIDAEFAFSKDYAEKIGVDTDKLMVSQPSTAEEALDIIDKISKTGEVDIIVLDSVASLVPEKEFEGEISDVGIAIQARIMSKGLRMLAGNIAKTKTSVIFINQVRDKVGVFFGNKTTTPGGKALKFFSSVRLEVRKGKQIKETRNGKEEVIGNWLGIVAVKNKVGIPWRKTELELIFEKGIDITGDYLDSCVEEKVILKTGNTYNFGDVALGGSRDKAKKFLNENEKTFDKMKKALLNKDENKK